MFRLQAEGSKITLEDTSVAREGSALPAGKVVYRLRLESAFCRALLPGLLATELTLYSGPQIGPCVLHDGRRIGYA
jgi:hypothetical protein